MNFRLIIAGGRLFSEYEVLKAKANVLTANTPDITVVSGGAHGADILGERWAHEYSHHIERFTPMWDLYGKSAGYKRNAQMANNADALLAFWDGKSKGTKHMIDLAHRKGLEIRVINY